MTEQQVIEQLSRYRQIKARILVLSTYNVGAGITVSRLNQDDQLQDLHRRLRGLPSYMYLTEREQRLETTAHAYLTRYPAGVKSQQRAIPAKGADAEDDKLLQELRYKIQKVIEARGYDVRSDLDEVLNRVAELQELLDEVNRIDTVLEALEKYKPEYAKLLRLRYVEGKQTFEVASELHIVRQTLYRWEPKAIKAYIKLAV
ncbi:ECF-type sigma factor [Paenibacillus paeoniae]|uniref:Sigma-70 family RNA polymerase sigma factor n=1 Tax=Paenibacillus paeoniae TaxID=2292705 RepID=A0A371P160_9BACL|nr:ECF-type sigma factor [Paenibacillus paeoniae]REK69328.1 sigma-70 family RNA polymerase sigma factor [Paenibacillus paeoniae]